VGTLGDVQLEACVGAAHWLDLSALAVPNGFGRLGNAAKRRSSFECGLEFGMIDSSSSSDLISLRMAATTWSGDFLIMDPLLAMEPFLENGAEVTERMEATEDVARGSDGRGWDRATWLSTSCFVVARFWKAIAITAAIMESISFGRASMSCQPQKMRAPILCAVEMASLAFSCWSKGERPGLIMSGLTASGATADISCNQKTPDLISGSPKRES